MEERAAATSDDEAQSRQGLLDYWTVYSANYATVYAETLRVAREHPLFGPMIRAVPNGQVEAQSQTTRTLLLAALKGDWEPYAASLREQGCLYATRGVTFDAWYDIVRVYQRALLPLVVAAFAADPVRLSHTLVAMHDFLDRGMGVIAKAYFDTKQNSLEEQRALAEARARELEASEAALRAQTSIMESVLDSLRDGVVVADHTGATLMINQAGREITRAWPDRRSDPSAPRSYADADTGAPIAASDVPLQRAVRGERIDDQEMVIRFPGTEDRVISVRGGPLLASAGVRGGVVSFRDVTERRRMKEMTDRSRELEEENRRVKEANRLKSEFLANMSHELRTPLNAIIGFSELLFDGAVDPASPQHREFLGDILGSGRHLLQLINDILDLSKVEAGKMDFRPEQVDLEELVLEVTTILRGQAAAKHIQVATSVDPALTDVVIDAGRFKQVLYNYLSNALKFTGEGGHVAVRATVEGPDAFRLEVEDSGVGIAAEDLSRLFVEFQQLEAGAAKHHVGTGLGLALTRGLVEAQGGAVGARSEVGKGSVFHVVLPQRSSVRTSLPDRVVHAGSHVAAPRILVIEDDPRDQEFLVRTLAGAGYAVETVSTGAQALESLRQRRFDAVTLDLVLPDVSGLEVLRAIRAATWGANTPVLVVSVAADRGTAAGFAVHDMLQKPVEPAALLESLRRAGLTPGVGHVLVVDDDPASLRLMEVTLSQLGYQAVCKSDPMEALRSLEATPPIAVVLDLRMPGMDGFEFLERLRDMPSTRQTPVIIWTVKDLSGDEQRRLRATSDAVVCKGGSVALLEEMRAVLPVRQMPRNAQ